jgi:hypothetical protein
MCFGIRSVSKFVLQDLKELAVSFEQLTFSCVAHRQ